LKQAELDLTEDRSGETEVHLKTLRPCAFTFVVNMRPRRNLSLEIAQSCLEPALTPSRRAQTKTRGSLAARGSIVRMLVSGKVLPDQQRKKFSLCAHPVCSSEIQSFVHELIALPPQT
jgi:hypothetical protein